VNPIKFITKPIGCLCSLLGALILIIVAAAVIGLWSFNYLAPSSIEKAIELRGGFPARIDAAGYDVFDSSFHLEDIVIENPPNFPERDFLHIRALTLDAAPQQLIGSSEKSIERLTLNIERFNWVLTEGGTSNIGLFARSVGSLAAPPDPTSLNSPEPPKGFVVGTWVIKIGTIEISDYGRSPTRREKFIVNYERAFPGVSDPEEVIKVVASDLDQHEISPVIRLLLKTLVQLPALSELNEKLDSSTKWIRDQSGKVFDASEKSVE